MGITQVDMLTGLDKVETAIALIQTYEPPEGYIVAYSGGKDSDATLDIVRRSGAQHIAEYYDSPIDPPELRQYIKDCHPEVKWVRNARGFWKMVTIKGLPRRRSRWCCEVIKESGGLGRVVVTGSRSGESRGRSSQKCFSKFKNQDKHILRPINSWTVKEVWEYIRVRELSYCKLYDEGAARKGYGEGDFTRLGCVLCPLASYKNRMHELERFPKIAKLWRLSCDHIIERRNATGRTYKREFADGQELWDWWISFK